MSIEFYLQMKFKEFSMKLKVRIVSYFNGYKIAIDHILFKYMGLRQYVIFNYPYIYPYICYESKGNRYSSNCTTTDTVLQVLFINWQTLKQITWSQCKGQLILWMILIIQDDEWWCPWCLLKMNGNSCLKLTTHIV